LGSVVQGAEDPVTKCIADLKSKNSQTRYWAARYLGPANDPRAIDPLIEVLKDYHDGTRVAAQYALAQIEDPRAAHALLKAAESSDEKTRGAALDALSSSLEKRKVPGIGRPLTYLLVTSTGAPNDHAGSALQVACDPEALPRVIAIWATGNAHVKAAAELIVLVTATNPEAIPYFIKASTVADAEARKLAVSMMKPYGPMFEDPRVVDALVSALKDTDPNVRFEAVRNLAMRSDPRAAEALITALQDGHPGVRRCAALGLGVLNHPQAVEPLTTALNDTIPDVKIAAELALVAIKNGDVERFISASRDKDPLVNLLAVAALKRKKDPKATEALVAALNEGPDRVRLTARDAIMEMKDPKALSLLQTALKTQSDRINEKKEAAGLLAAMKDPGSVEVLIGALKDKRLDVRLAAAEALGTLRNSRAISPLVVLVSDKTLRDRKAWHSEDVFFDGGLDNKARKIRIAGVNAIGAIGGEGAMKALIQFLPDWNLGPIAARALHSLGWAPGSDEEKIHFLVATRQGAKLQENMGLTRRILFADLKAKEMSRTENAAFALIALGADDATPVLIKTLRAKGSKDLAETYFNCGEIELGKAADQWAKKKRVPFSEMGSKERTVCWKRF